jgi:hypothetical protein
MINPIFDGVSILSINNEAMEDALLPKFISGEINCCMARAWSCLKHATPKAGLGLSGPAIPVGPMPRRYQVHPYRKLLGGGTAQQRAVLWQRGQYGA